MLDESDDKSPAENKSDAKMKRKVENIIVSKHFMISCTHCALVVLVCVSFLSDLPAPGEAGSLCAKRSFGCG